MQYFEDIAARTKAPIVSSYIGNPLDLYLAQLFVASQQYILLGCPLRRIISGKVHYRYWSGLGIVESGVKYIKRGFVPLREFRDLADANQQLQAWVMAQAGNRVHGTTREVPLQRF